MAVVVESPTALDNRSREITTSKDVDDLKS